MDFPRFLLILGSFSPLFMLWAIRGVGGWDGWLTFVVCMLLAVLPNAYLMLLISIRKQQNDRKPIAIHAVTDNREHLLVYVFAMLIPLYDANLGSSQDALATFAAFLFIVFLFGHMGLYYMNFWFAFFGYRIVTVVPEKSLFSVSHVLLTKKTSFPPAQSMTPLRITDGLLFDDSK